MHRPNTQPLSIYLGFLIVKEAGSSEDVNQGLYVDGLVQEVTMAPIVYNVHETDWLFMRTGKLHAAYAELKVVRMNFARIN